MSIGLLEASADPRRSTVGLIYCLCSAVVFGVTANVVKCVSLQPLVMLEIQSSIQLVVSFHCALRAKDGAASSRADRLFGPPQWRRLLALRALMYWGFMALWWGALTEMPVGDATAIVYCAPIATGAFARLFLREQLGRGYVPCLAASLVGVCLVTQPGFLFSASEKHAPGYFQGFLLAILAAILGGALPVAVRKSRDCHWATVEHVTALCQSTVTNPLGLLVLFSSGLAEAPNFLDNLQAVPLVFLAALLGFVGLGLQTKGYQMTDATKGSLVTLVEIPFTYMLQWLVFRDSPNFCAISGMALIIASSIILALLNKGERASGDIEQGSCKVDASAHGGVAVHDEFTGA